MEAKTQKELQQIKSYLIKQALKERAEFERKLKSYEFPQKEKKEEHRKSY